MTDNLEEIGLAAVDRFIEGFNSREPAMFAAALNYPHVRPGPFGPLVASKDADEYVSQFSYDRAIAMGWDHSEFDYKQVVHLSAGKLHVAGQWSRYDKDGNKIISNPVTYIVTHVDEHWGIQSRFSADYAGDEDTSSMEKRVFNLIESFVIHFNNANVAAAAELLNYPHYSIGTGSLEQTDSTADYRLPGANMSIDSLMALQTGNRSANVAMDFTLSESGRSRPMQAVLNVTERDDHLGIQAWSLLNPNDQS
ncbi:MAG TPA: hypothetical protein VJ998_04765 [Pseudomonadales bacterium]|nr:hypothetical protein [Pseudomonadales bacterium]